MSEIFFIGDTHFGHKNILVFEQTSKFRPFATIEEHDEELIARWNSVVGKQDEVWHLGDVAFGKKSLDLCERLHGRKYLIMGNHDGYGVDNYLKYFKEVYGAFARYGYLMTHVPVHPQQLTRKTWDSGNIHGHLHTFQVMRETWDEIREPNPHDYLNPRVRLQKRLEVDPRYVNVSCEQIGLTPITLDEIKIKQKGRHP